jgi:hypothetical protein
VRGGRTWEVTLFAHGAWNDTVLIHSPGRRVSKTEATRRAARELREDAQALRAQAKHQISRARDSTGG